MLRIREPNLLHARLNLMHRLDLNYKISKLHRIERGIALLLQKKIVLFEKKF